MTSSTVQTSGVQTSGAQTTHIRPVHHRTAEVGGHTIAYREAGDVSAPTVLLLHGFPTSSFMFRGLIHDLAGSYHVVAPDYVGFGDSSAPSVTEFDYTFDSLAAVTTEFLDVLGVRRFAVYVQDYGAPVGLRIASRNPDRVTALIAQNGNAYADGLNAPFWDAMHAFWKDRPTHEAAVRELLRTDDFRWQYTHGVPADRLDLVSPDTWTLDRAHVDRPGNVEVQLELFWDYRTNLDVYPTFHAYFRTHQPPTLLPWGRNDEIFGEVSARAYLTDLPNAELHLLDAGHFALETHREEIAALIHEFLPRALGTPAG